MISETSVEFKRTTWRYIPEDTALHSYCCENLKSYINKLLGPKKAPWLWSASELCLCDLVVRVSGYRPKGSGFDSRRFQIF
jgi:hypothetical protein